DLIGPVPDGQRVAGPKRIHRICAAHINSRLDIAATGCVGGGDDFNSTLVLQGTIWRLQSRAHAAAPPPLTRRFFESLTSHLPGIAYRACVAGPHVIPF